MYIVGTSGHIDHGKTSIIKSLTGTDCDRLPEEKEREMTIDIGFASIEYPRFGTVSIIDVPGHERFIRNMVVGAWGIDLALLVVAADDGWMPQTEDHFRVLQLLGIERIIVVISKLDLADEEMINFVEEEIRDKLMDTEYDDADIVRVSSKTGDGIASLKELIVDNLRKLSRASNSEKPYLFVDRVFQSKGYGTVITGTLKNGIFHDNDSVFVLPGKEEARIKRIESHFNERHEGTPSQRTALNLSGISTKDVHRGSIICRHNFFTDSGEVVVKLQLLKKRQIRNNLGIEMLIGTAGLKGKIILIDTDITDKLIFTARIKVERQWFFYPGQPFVITSPGGYRILGGGIVLYPHYEPLKHRKSIRESLGLLKTYSTEEIVTFVIAIDRWMTREKLLSMFPESIKKIDRTLKTLAENDIIVLTDTHIIMKQFREASLRDIGDAIAGSVGLNLQEISHQTGIDHDMCRLLINEVVIENSIIEKDGRYFAGDAITEDTLDAAKRKLLEEILNKNKDGIEIDKLKDDRMKKDIRDMVKIGFIISLDGNIMYHRDIYNDLKEKIIRLFDEKDKISIPEAKEAVDLSRKYIIPLLNRIENEGHLKRIGDFRIKS